MDIESMPQYSNATIVNRMAQSGNRPIVDKSSFVNPQSSMDAAA